MPVVWPSYTCIRYMPMLRLPVRGSRVCTQGSVIKRPPSCGQHFRIGNAFRSKPSRRMTSLHGASFALTVFGNALVSAPSCGSIFSLSSKPSGAFMFISPWMRSAISSKPLDAQRQRHAPLAAELVDQNLVARMPLHVLKQQCRPAGLHTSQPSLAWAACRPRPIFETRSVISVISSSGETSSRMRFSSPCFFQCLDPVAQIVVGQGCAPCARQQPRSTLSA